MRHNVYGKKLGRTKNERQSLFRNLVHSLFIEERIETTQAKATAIKGLVDKLITQAKSPNTRRLLSQFLTNKKAEEKLTKDILKRIGDRKSGFTSITKVGKRQGDGTMMVAMSLIVEAPKKVAPASKVVATKEVKEKVEANK